ncbi:transposase [Caballeronia sp. NK8]|uniref:transposase n=1 Tax=Caballeronia sp. NK8 TaxID=140098 RepID=UPI0026573105|nr:transposase [Caballeronia sp. NK8]
MLQYKCADASVWFEEVNEAFSTQTCSCCSSRTGPKGIAGLGIREWRCEACGSNHERDVNAPGTSSLLGRHGAPAARDCRTASHQPISRPDVAVLLKESRSFRAGRTSSPSTFGT